ncbi:hypothetical protein EVJ58_g9628 [Rhodofomes roseus]|uniref:Uncharacterized protein n=1 Tax=Rhodofomes roseus TaxID=34475 RepID=A0A4Y9XSK2_9APHY|nr:hypothetical protein EVJ58_g9628 [Rhodofomes roseus]
MSVIETGLSSAGELELRAHAFSELKRSVAESGEGQVQRLRDMENSRWRLSVDQRDRNDPPRGPRAQPGLPVLQNAEPATAWDEEDDVEIVSSEPASGSAHLHNRSSSCKKRAMSLNMMDMDIDVPDVDGPLSPALPSAEPSERCSSPFSAFTGPSVYSSEDDMSPVELDGATPYSEPNVPRLTLSYTASSNPSVVSLSPSSFAEATPAKAGITDSATRSEKAIAALALAMANGACGLNDYSAIQHTEHTLDPSDGCQVGELWH